MCFPGSLTHTHTHTAKGMVRQSQRRHTESKSYHFWSTKPPNPPVKIDGRRFIPELIEDFTLGSFSPHVSPLIEALHPYFGSGLDWLNQLPKGRGWNYSDNAYSTIFCSYDLSAGDHSSILAINGGSFPGDKGELAFGLASSVAMGQDRWC